MTRNIMITVRVDNSFYKRIKKLADIEDLPVATLCRKILFKYINEYELKNKK